MNGIVNWLKGKKTYITAAAIVGLGVAEAFICPIPTIVYVLAGAAGLAGLRAGVTKVANGLRGAR